MSLIEMELTLDQALQKGIEAHKAGKAQEADRYYTAILKAQPKHPDANHNMGILAITINKPEKALPFFKTALEANPNIAQYWLSYIDALIKLDRMADAKAVFDQAKSNGAKGDGFDKLEQRLGASASPKAITRDSGLPQDQLQTLMGLYNQGEAQQVFEQAQKLTKKYPEALALWNLMGASGVQIGQLDQAVLAFQNAINIKPDYATAYNNMGNALKDQGKHEEAIEAYSKALSIKPDFAEVYYNMGIALKDYGKEEEAIEAYSKAINIQPDYAAAHFNMGLALKAQGKIQEAIEAYSKAISIDPNDPESYNNIGIALKDQGKEEEAIEAYNTALLIKPDYVEAKKNLVETLKV